MTVIKIAYVIDWIYSPEGGTERQLLMLLNGLDRARFTPHLVYLRDTEFLTNTRFGFPVTKIPVGKLVSPGFVGGLRAFRKLHQRERFDIVQTLFIDANVFGTIAAHYAGCRVILSSRRNIGYWHDSAQVAMLRFLRRWTTHYLANSMAAVEKTVETEGVPAERITVIRNGLDLDQFSRTSPELRATQREQWGVGPNDIVVGAVANLRKVKNIESLMRAAVTLVKEHDNLVFVWCGKGFGGEHEHYLQLVDEMGLQGRFHFPGGTEDVVRALSGFDIGVLCSTSESFSNSLVEYMAAGLPIVASDVGGNREAIDHERTGLLYPIDRDDLLTESLRRLITDRELAQKLGRQAQDTARTAYSREAMLKQHEDFYYRILGREK
ncbi:MAG: glycosyltransferase [candidate division Zixibacteria bacterium]|nr:glycosyltransferase [candidate division Zixibacteria bacterium]